VKIKRVGGCQGRPRPTSSGLAGGRDERWLQEASCRAYNGAVAPRLTARCEAVSSALIPPVRATRR
jgi:hypothetical protein